MGADSTLVNAAFKEAGTRAGAEVPNLKPLYESTVKQGKQSLDMITGVMDELKQDELNRIAGSDAQMQEFTGLVNKMDKMLAIDKLPLPQKVIIAIEEGVKDLQQQFEAVNTYGDGDTRENERARTRINGELQKLVSSAVNTRGGMMKIGKTIDDVNGIEFTDDNRAIASQMINLEDMDTDDRISVGVVNGQITFTASKYNTTTMFTNPMLSEETKEIQYGEPVSWNIDQIVEAIPMKDKNFDLRAIAGLKDAKLGGATAQAGGQAKESYNLEGAVRDIKATIKTKEDFMNIAQRELEGTDIQGFRTGLLASGELQLGLIEAMFTDNLGNVNPIYETLAALDNNDDGEVGGKPSITSADQRGLTGEALKTWKDNSMALIDMITMVNNKNFNLAVSTDIISNYLGDHQRQEFEDAWEAADKKENPGKYKESGISRTPMSASMLYQLEQQKIKATTTIADINAGKTIIGVTSAEHVQKVGNNWVFKIANSISSAVPISTPKSELDQLIINHISGTYGKYTMPSYDQKTAKTMPYLNGKHDTTAGEEGKFYYLESAPEYKYQFLNGEYKEIYE
jgi:hypothetical protein